MRAFGRPNSFPNSLSAVALCITRDFGKINYVLCWFPSRLPATLENILCGRRVSRLVSLPGGCLPGHRVCAFVLCFCVMCIALFYIVCISMVVGVERAFAMSDLFSNPLSAVVFS